jgi:hypothetical protein
MKAVPHSKLTWAAIIAVLLMGASTGLAYLTDDITVVGGIRDLMGPLGLVAAGLCGLAFANYVSSNTRGASSPKGTAAAFIVIALLLAWASGRALHAYRRRFFGRRLARPHSLCNLVARRIRSLLPAHQLEVFVAITTS